MGAGSNSSPGRASNLGPLLQNLSDKRSNRENPPKRRGPKPDSKPALTRRQELNRQAQRTHRERKEQYVKSLEDELLRVKDLYSKVSRDKDTLLEETRHLKNLLMLNGIPFNTQPGMAPSSNYGSEDFATASSVFSPAPSQFSNPSQGHVSGPGPSSVGSQGSGMVDPEQAGIDFVLKLERPCMVHRQIIDGMVNSSGGPPCGHAMMASCAPPEQNQDTPFNAKWTAGEAEMQTWDLSKGDLARLLDLSSKLELDGEITPVMAWKMVTMDPRVARLNQADFDAVATRLMERVRCYGFGAVMEAWEVRDAMENVLGHRNDAMVF